MNKKIILTRADILRLRTERGGWRRAAVAQLGVPWPLKSGWIDRLVGTEISLERYAEASRQAGSR